MSRFIQDGTGVVVSVDDSKDERFAVGYKPFNADSKSTQKKAPAAKPDNN